MTNGDKMTNGLRDFTERRNNLFIQKEWAGEKHFSAFQLSVSIELALSGRSFTDCQGNIAPASV